MCAVRRASPCQCKTSGSHGFILAQTRLDHFYNRSFHRLENITSLFITLKDCSRQKICAEHQLTLHFGFHAGANIIIPRLTAVSPFSFDALRLRLHSAVCYLGHCCCLRARAGDWAWIVLHQSWKNSSSHKVRARTGAFFQTWPAATAALWHSRASSFGQRWGRRSGVIFLFSWCLGKVLLSYHSLSAPFSHNFSPSWFSLLCWRFSTSESLRFLFILIFLPDFSQKFSTRCYLQLPSLPRCCFFSRAASGLHGGFSCHVFIH